MPRVKKVSVLKEMDIEKDSGVYCIYPFSNFDNKGKGVFKIGITTKEYDERLTSHYHSYFPRGFYYCCFLRELDKTNTLTQKETAKLYTKIEKFIFKNIKNSKRIDCDVRFSKTSEWFYTSQKDIFDVFDLAQKEFEGDVVKYKITPEIFQLNENNKTLTTMTIRF